MQRQYTMKSIATVLRGPADIMSEQEEYVTADYWCKFRQILRCEVIQHLSIPFLFSIKDHGVLACGEWLLIDCLSLDTGSIVKQKGERTVSSASLSCSAAEDR